MRKLTALLLTVIPVVAVASLLVGAAHLSLGELSNAFSGNPDGQLARTILFDVRLPRIVAAITVGAALAIAGAILQSTFANPLVDSSLIGISTFASVGGALTLALGTTSPFALALGALVAAGIASVVLNRSSYSGLRFVLFGFALGALGSAILAVAVELGRAQNSRSLTSWLFGTLSLATWTGCAIMAIALLLGIFLVRTQYIALDIATLGKATAGHLGVDVSVARRRWLLITVILVAPSVALFGAVGFVGLVAPHLARAVGAVTHRALIVTSALFGSLVVLIADTAARTLSSTMELPLSLTLALIGAPTLFVVLRGYRHE